MPTLDPTQVIPPGVALRLRRLYVDRYEIDYFAVADGNDAPERRRAAQVLKSSGGSSGLDEHAARADCCALADYFEANRGLVIPDGTTPDPSIVPWSYARYRGTPAPRAAA